MLTAACGSPAEAQAYQKQLAALASSLPANGDLSSRFCEVPPSAWCHSAGSGVMLLYCKRDCLPWTLWLYCKRGYLPWRPALS